MKNKKFKITAISAVLAATAGAGLLALNTNSQNSQSALNTLLGGNTANALGTNNINYSPSGLTSGVNFNVTPPAGSEGMHQSWGIAGNTEVQVIQGNQISDSDSNQGDWAGANKPRNNVAYYSINPGDKYRITNIGKTITSNTTVDAIIEINDAINPVPNSKQFISFDDSSLLGPADRADPYHSISVLAGGVHQLNTHITYVKSGTNDPVTVTTGTYWSDIDIMQGIDERQSNNQVIFPGDNQGTLPQHDMLLDGQTVYSPTMTDLDGMSDPNEGAYIGIGTSSDFYMHFWNPYTGGQNSSISDVNSSWRNFRYDMFGYFPNIKFPVPITNPTKTVSDADENNSDHNTNSLKDHKQTYHIGIDVGNGDFLQKLNLTDHMPPQFAADTNTVHITNSAGKDITGLFDIHFDGQTFTANVKGDQLSNGDLFNTHINVDVSGTETPEWGPNDSVNNAVWNDGQDHPTGDVHTYTPTKPVATKSVSVDGGKTYTPSDTAELSSRIIHRGDSYIWKNDFTLSNRTNFNKVILDDHMESLQSVDNGDVHVYDWNGNDVTSQGTITQTPANGKNDVSWTANPDYVGTINKNFGINSNDTPKFSMTIKTSIKNSTKSQEAPYWDAGLKKFVIPNITTGTEGDNSGDVSTDTNPSNVTPPTPVTINTPKKTVSDADEPESDHNTNGLKDHKQTYHMSIHTSDGDYLPSLVLNDTFPDQFAADTNSVHIKNSNGDDVTGDFDIKFDGQKFSATVKSDQDQNMDKKLINTEITVDVSGTEKPDWGPNDSVNKASWTDDDQDLPTGEVHTYTPTAPTATKSVSVDGGKTYTPSDTPDKAAALSNRPDNYIWKNDFTLSSRTNFTNVSFVDHMESLQKVDNGNVHVYDWSGKDVTNQGQITQTPANGKNDVTWTANPDYIADINKSFGIDSADTPKFSMTIQTNIKDASDAQEAPYWNADLKKFVFPNVSTLHEADYSGDVPTDTNKSNVTPPTPQAPKAPVKQVALDGTDPMKETGWTDKLALANHDQKYEYRTTFNLSKDYNFDAGNLVLTDHFENLQSYKDVKILDSKGNDITKDFDMKVSDASKTTKDITATVNEQGQKEMDDTGQTIYMVIDGATIEGATGSQEINYLEPHTKDGGLTKTEDGYETDPFKEGVTIPNISEVNEISKVKDITYDAKTGHTYVNIDIAPSLTKAVEEDNDSDTILDPDKATSDSDSKSTDTKSAKDKTSNSKVDDSKTNAAIKKNNSK